MNKDNFDSATAAALDYGRAYVAGIDAQLAARDRTFDASWRKVAEDLEEPLDTGLLERQERNRIVGAYFHYYGGSYPKRIFQYRTWADIPNDSSLDADTLVYVGGGILKEALDLGNATVVTNGGLIEAELTCGRGYSETFMVTKGGRVRYRSGEQKTA